MIKICKMKRIILILFLIVNVIVAISAPKNKKPILKFNEDGKFKIIQFTDIHFKYNSYRSDSALMMMKAAIEAEKPDLIVLTGDVVCTDRTRDAWYSLSKTFIESEVPWAVILGNHDIESELTGKQIMEIVSDFPNSLTENGPEDISGAGNYILKIQGFKSSDPEAVLYFLDSHSGLKKEDGLGRYEWIKSDQVEWYRNESKKLTAKNGGKPYPALAFFHIPLIEYNEVWGAKTTVGVKEESVCSPDINSGMYNAFLESKDVMGMFVGHDHVNNYIGCLRGICMAYGQSSGRETYGKPKGYRIIELYEGERKFDTWVQIKYNANRDKDTWKPTNSNERINFVTYPDSFAEKK